MASLRIPVCAMPALSALLKHPLPIATVTVLLLLLGWDASGLDIVAAAWVGNASGFPLQDHWFLARVMHAGARQLAWALVFGLFLMALWPQGPFRSLEPARRWQLAASTLLLALAISIIKSASLTSCPWDLKAFGGVADHLSHWALMRDGGPGRCFPAGHASAAFAFMSGYFVFRDKHPRLARRWLVVTLVAGLALGGAQQLRGAHFMSHTLWTGWLCWCMAWGLDALWRLKTRRQAWPAAAGGH